MIKTFFAKLDKKQQYLVIGGAAFVLIALILELIVFPFGEAKARTARALQSNQKKLNEMIRLDAEFSVQEVKLAAIRSALQVRPANFTLFSYLERKAAQAGVKGNIKNMNSARGLQSANWEETLIEMKLEKITIKQLADFLNYAESSADLVKIKRLTVNKMKESPEYLSAQLQIASWQMLPPAKGGN